VIIGKVLQERSERYGSFIDRASITQSIKHAMASPGWHRLAADQKEALETIATKIARILNGDPDYIDNWVDIAGYATLVVERLEAAGSECSDSSKEDHDPNHVEIWSAGLGSDGHP
jgi:hypothetical protein